MNQQTLIFLGPQGSGKGTHAIELQNDLAKLDPSIPVVHFEMGKNLREIAAQGSYTGELLKEIISRGELVPFNISSSVLSSYLMQHMHGNEHLIIDGFPRSDTQMEVLDATMAFYKRENPTVVHINISDEEGLKRLLLRGRADDTEDFPCFVDVPPHHQRIAVVEAQRDGPDRHRAGRLVIAAYQQHAPRRDADIKSVRQERDVARNSISVRVEHAGELHAAGILLEMILKRADQAIARQSGEEADLRCDHAIGTRDQVVVDLEVDEPEQYRDEDREQACQCGSPVKRVRAYELHLTLRILPSDALAGPRKLKETPKVLREE